MPQTKKGTHMLEAPLRRQRPSFAHVLVGDVLVPAVPAPSLGLKQSSDF